MPTFLQNIEVNERENFWRKKNRVKVQKGYNKNYLNQLRGVGCPRSNCCLCRSLPVNKSLKKAKGRNKKRIKMEDYMED